MRVQELRITPIDSGQRGLVKVIFEMGSTTHEIYFKSDNAALTANAEAFIALALVPCMKRGISLAVNGEVSQKFLDAIEIISDIYQAWETGFRKVEIKNVIPIKRSSPETGRSAAFFSGGVDSFFTLLKHRTEITDLIFLHGYDIGLQKNALRNRVSETVRQIASDLGKNVIEIETNLRSFLSFHEVDWEKLGHGPALVSVGLLLSPMLTRIYISSSLTYGVLYPGGTHPFLDPLWSTEGLQFVHDGCEATRVTKAKMISQYDLALKSLRVCWENPHGAYNCGVCEKCIRTMINLLAAGSLDRCTTFDAELDPKRVARIRLEGEAQCALAMQNLRALESRQTDREIYYALRKAVTRAQRREALRRCAIALFPRVHQGLLWLDRSARRIYRTLKFLFVIH